MINLNSQLIVRNQFELVKVRFVVMKVSQGFYEYGVNMVCMDRGRTQLFRDDDSMSLSISDPKRHGIRQFYQM